VKRSQPSHRGGDSAVLSARTGPRTRVDADARRTVACCGDEYRRHISEEAPTDHVRVEHALSRVDEFSVRCAVHDREPTREPRLTLQQRWRPERHPLAARRGTEFGANLQMLDGPVSVRECGIPVREGSNWWRYRHLCAVMMVLVPSECARHRHRRAPGRAGSGGGMGAPENRHPAVNCPVAPQVQRVHPVRGGQCLDYGVPVAAVLAKSVPQHDHRQASFSRGPVSQVDAVDAGQLRHSGNATRTSTSHGHRATGRPKAAVSGGQPAPQTAPPRDILRQDERS
jgi:hypothetical protein